jgi:3-oxoacyl-[acyl-carrier protein] reductase
VDLRLDGKVAVVTGASKGIGRAVAVQPAHQSADVVITARTSDSLQVAARQIAAGTGRVIGAAQRKAIMDQ